MPVRPSPCGGRHDAGHQQLVSRNYATKRPRRQQDADKADEKLAPFATTYTDYGIHSYLAAPERVNAFTGNPRPSAGSNPYQIQARGLELPLFPTTYSDYGLYVNIPLDMRDLGNTEFGPGQKGKGTMGFWQGKLEAYDRVLQRLSQQPDRQEKTPWRTTNAEYGIHTKSMSGSVSAMHRKPSLTEQMGMIRASADMIGALSEKSEKSSSTARQDGQPAGGAMLPALDRSKYLVARTPGHAAPLEANENAPGSGHAVADGPTIPASNLPRYGPAWMYMQSNHNRLLKNVENLRGAYQAARNVSSDILIVEKTDQECAVPGLEGTKSRASHSVPSTASSLSSSSFATTTIK